MLRVVGVMLVFGGSLCAGIGASQFCRRRVMQLEAFYEFASYIRRQIDGYLTPLEHIYASFDNRVLEMCGFIGEMRDKGAAEAMVRCRSCMQLKDAEAAEIYGFLKSLGRGGADEEIKRCRAFELRMGELLETARSGSAGEIRMCRAFGALVGILLTVILL